MSRTVILFENNFNKTIKTIILYITIPCYNYFIFYTIIIIHNFNNPLRKGHNNGPCKKCQLVPRVQRLLWSNWSCGVFFDVYISSKIDLFGEMILSRKILNVLPKRYPPGNYSRSQFNNKGRWSGRISCSFFAQLIYGKISFTHSF